MGYAGQVSFGHNAFAAISGYTSAVLTANHGWEPLPAAALGIFGALACALIVGYPTLRLRGHYLAMATLAIGLIVYEVAVQWQSVTQGYMGISGIPPLGIGRFTVTSDRALLVLLIAFALIGVLAAAGIRRSRLGRAFVAIAGSEDAARALGIDVARYKLIAFLISAFYAAVAGSLFVHAVGFVSPEVLRPAHGRARLHDALCRRHRHDRGRGARRAGHRAAARNGAALQRVSGSRLWRGADPDPDLCAGRPRVALAALVATQGGRMSLLRLSAVTRRFGGLVAVDNVSLDIAAGGVTAIIGPNGAGKTTLFNVISGFTAPSAGRVEFAGADITGLAAEEIAKRGLVRTFQLVQLFENLTVLENVKVGRHLHTKGGLASALLPPRARTIEADVEAFARDLLQKVGLDAHADTLAGVLPYGQKRLLEIARALAAEPKLLMLDEPAAGLNRGETTRLAALIRQIVGLGVTVLLIEHDMSFVMNIADRLAVLDFGKLIADGNAGRGAEESGRDRRLSRNDGSRPCLSWWPNPSSAASRSAASTA